jgi:16S rRNA (adenine1518-N6/adenine1519-N6)-dimethyltransferase
MMATSVKELLAAHGLAPRKFLGQNFMVDSNFAAAIAREARLDEQTLVLEAGPGTGCLTRAMLQACAKAKIVAIEIDRGLAKLLRETFAPEINACRLVLLEGDVLAGKHLVSPQFVEAARRISAEEKRPRRILCANLPYNAATPLLACVALDRQGLALDEALVTIQLELAERMLAGPGVGNYGALSVLLALRAEGKILRRAGGEIFWPRPEVESAVVNLRFKPWDTSGAGSGLRREEAQPFQAFLRKIFSQRRKTLRAVLKPQTLPQLPEKTRAEELGPLELLALFRAIYHPADQTEPAH